MATVNQPLITLLLVGLGYLVPTTLLLWRRGARAVNAVLLSIWLVANAVWVLSAIPEEMNTFFPTIDWLRLGGYILIGLSVFFLEFTRSFLHKTGVFWLSWVIGGIAMLSLGLLEAGLITVPSFAWSLGALQITNETVHPILRWFVPTAYALTAWLIVLNDYFRRLSPLHRNRMLYWMISTAAIMAGGTLLSYQQWVSGSLLNWLGGMILTYTLINPHLTDLSTGMRVATRYVFGTLIPIAIVVGLSSGVVYLLGLTSLFSIRLTGNIFFSMLITGVLVFLIYQPIRSFTRRALNRVLFGQGYDTQEVVREYSQAISHVISLEGLTAAAMGIINNALGIQRGTLLVIDDMDERGWWMRVLPGLGVPFGEPRLFLRQNSPLAVWFAEHGEPLHQYILDVDPRFQEQNPREMQEWRQLNMEVFLPIRRSEAMIGLIALGLRRSGHAYTTPELQLLQTLADQTGVALENATLFDGVQQRAEQLALLNEIGQVITSSLDLEPALQLIAKRIENAFKGMTGFIFLMNDAEQSLFLHTVFGTKRTLTSALNVGPGRGLVGWVALNGKPALAADLQADSRYDSQVEGFLVPKGRAALCVPVRAQDKTIGVILIIDPSRTSLGPAELSLLDSIASFASIAIENARKVAAREEMLQRQLETLRIEVDELKREQQVHEIVETEFFQDLRSRASEMRQRQRDSRARNENLPSDEERTDD